MKLLFAFLIGFCLIGGNKLRTIQILEGKRENAVLMTAMIASCAWFAFGFVAKGELSSYICFGAGEALAVWWLAGKKRI